jgi:hypothetical protein
VAKLAVVGPLGKADLADEPRLDPVHPPGRRQAAPAERRIGPFQAREPVVQAQQGLAAEPGADLARVDQFAVTVVVTEEQRAESDPGALRVGVAADDELLPVLALELQPVPVASALVGGIGPLGDQALPAVPAGLREVLLAVAVAVRGEPERVTEVECTAQQRLTFPQGQRPGVPAVCC